MSSRAIGTALRLKTAVCVVGPPSDDLVAVRTQSKLGEDDGVPLHELTRGRVAHEGGAESVFELLQATRGHDLVQDGVERGITLAPARSSSASAPGVSTAPPRANWK